MTAAFLHIWNHALMKGLMFFAAGSIVHGAGTKDMETFGGLMRRMPWTGALMMAGAVAIAALPPLNGFVSKWLIYLSLIRCGLAHNDVVSLCGAPVRRPPGADRRLGSVFLRPARRDRAAGLATQPIGRTRS